MKKLNTAKQKLRWSAVDTVILLLVLVAVAGLVYRVVYAARREGIRRVGTIFQHPNSPQAFLHPNPDLLRRHA